MSLANADTGELRSGQKTWLVRRGTTRRCSWSQIREYVFSTTGQVCVTCGGIATEVDHIWPRRWGGESFLENLQPLCGECNRRKGTQLLPEHASYEQLAAVYESIWKDLVASVNAVGEVSLRELGRRVRAGEITSQQGHAAVELLAGRAETVARSLRQLGAREFGPDL